MKTTTSFFSKHFAFSALLMTALLLTACEESPFDGLPPATQEGKNVMAFKVNGKAWKNDASAWDPGVEASYSKGLLQISGGKNNHDALFISLTGLVKAAGQFEINSECNSWAAISTCVECNYGGRTYRIPLQSTGLLSLSKFDTLLPDPIVAGTFEFDAVSVEDPTDTLHITDGRFDIQI